jgi:hypothetical protein
MRSGILGSSRSNRLLGSLESGDGETQEEPDVRHGQPYSDVAESENDRDQQDRL